MIKVVNQGTRCYTIYNNDIYINHYPTPQECLNMLQVIFPNRLVEWDIYRDRMIPLDYLNKQRKRLIEDRDSINSRIEILTDQLIEKCHHPISEIVVVPYGAHDLDANPSVRLCKICGLAEERSGSGYSDYKILGPHSEYNFPMVQRDAAQLLARKFIFRNDPPKFGK